MIWRENVPVPACLRGGLSIRPCPSAVITTLFLLLSPNRIPSALARSAMLTSGIDSSLGGACLLGRSNTKHARARTMVGSPVPQIGEGEHGGHAHACQYGGGGGMLSPLRGVVGFFVICFGSG